MDMINVIELYNETQKVQFRTQEEADAWAAGQEGSYEQRIIEVKATAPPPLTEKTQRQKYDFLKNLMLDFAEGLSKNPSEAFAVKADVEDLKFWAELGSAEAVIAKLQSIENNDIFTEAVKAQLISSIEGFLLG